MPSHDEAARWRREVAAVQPRTTSADDWIERAQRALREALDELGYSGYDGPLRGEIGELLDTTPVG